MLLEAIALGVDFPVGGGIFARARTLHAVRDVSLALPAGGALGIVGESGCGKSTLAMALLNLQPVSAGRVLLDGVDIRGMERAALARRVQPIFQDPYSSLNPMRSIGESILQPLRIHGIGDRAAQRAEMLRVMGLVGLPARFAGSFPDQLSGGQRQRVAIARALIMRPDILVCDEPTSALDVSVQSQILNLLADLRQELGVACVFISHNLAVIEHVADEVAVMYLGRIIEQAPTEVLFARPRHPYTAALLAAILTPEPALGIPEVMASGEYPDPLDPPAGCPFHPRCPIAVELCRTERPAFRGVGATLVACHLAEQA